MSDIAIRVEALGKKYRLGLTHHGTIRDAVNHWMGRIGAKLHVQRPSKDRGSSLATDGPHLAPGSQHTRDNGAKGKEFWALRDVSFEVKRAEVLGIIGCNGAGKSTLLRILSQVTKPTSGRAEVYGRVGSLLEVGTGFHPELTGRENVYLNGTMLGMTKREIGRKFDEIVDFAGVEEFIDTPVKRYSSGMHVRLGFAVAAHLEPEILIVDEVLAVGDASFQSKCLGKIGEVANSGRTIVFVSHNMVAIEAICHRVAVLDSGRLTLVDSPGNSIPAYLQGLAPAHFTRTTHMDLTRRKNSYGKHLYIRSARLLDAYGQERCAFKMGQELIIEVQTEGLSRFSDTLIGVTFKSHYDQWLASINSGMTCTAIHAPRRERECARLTLTRLPFTPGVYRVAISVTRDRVERLDYVECAATLSVIDSDVYGTGYQVTSHYGMVFLDGHWEIQPSPLGVANSV